MQKNGRAPRIARSVTKMRTCSRIKNTMWWYDRPTFDFGEKARLDFKEWARNYLCSLVQVSPEASWKNARSSGRLPLLPGIALTWYFDRKLMAHLGFIKTSRIMFIVCVWLRGNSSCSCFTVLLGPLRILLIEISIPFGSWFTSTGPEKMVCKTYLRRTQAGPSRRVKAEGSRKEFHRTTYEQFFRPLYSAPQN